MAREVSTPRMHVTDHGPNLSLTADDPRFHSVPGVADARISIMAGKTMIQLFSLVWSNWHVRGGDAVPQVLNKLKPLGQR
jgi:hypothetical protein